MMVTPMNTTVVRQPRRIRGVSFKRPAHRAPGQSMVLIALMLLVLIAFAGLSVDVGNAYAQQRRVQQASGAASLAGMAAVQNQKTNGGILDDIKRSLAANGIDFTGTSAYSYSANYIISGDNTPHAIASYTQSATPSNVERVQVTISNAVRTVFARVVGRPVLTVSATSHACLDGYNTAAVFPIGIPLQLDATNHTKYLAWDVATHTGSSLIPTTTPGWSAWHTYQNSPFHQSEYVKLPFGSGNGIPGVHMMWLEWGGQNGASTLNASIWFPGNLGKR